jgi:hypothetical protein
MDCARGDYKAKLWDVSRGGTEAGGAGKSGRKLSLPTVQAFTRRRSYDWMARRLFSEELYIRSGLDRIRSENDYSEAGLRVGGDFWSWFLLSSTSNSVGKQAGLSMQGNNELLLDGSRMVQSHFSPVPPLMPYERRRETALHGNLPETIWKYWQLYCQVSSANSLFNDIPKLGKQLPNKCLQTADETNRPATCSHTSSSSVPL